MAQTHLGRIHAEHYLMGVLGVNWFIGGNRFSIVLYMALLSKK